MYTTAPLPPIDTLNSHDGFVFLLAVVVFFTLVLIAYFEDDQLSTVFVVIAGVVIGMSAYQSWNSGTITEQKNEKVVGELVTFWGEQHQEERRSGKQTRLVTISNQYVTYKVPDGLVSFKIHEGQAWPEKAVFYKN